MAAPRGYDRGVVIHCQEDVILEPSFQWVQKEGQLLGVPHFDELCHLGTHEEEPRHSSKKLVLEMLKPEGDEGVIEPITSL